MRKKPTLIGFCSGIGGFEMGAKRAGFEVIYSSDVEKHVEVAFNLNTPGKSKFPKHDYRVHDGVFDINGNLF